MKFVGSNNNIYKHNIVTIKLDAKRRNNNNNK